MRFGRLNSTNVQSSIIINDCSFDTSIVFSSGNSSTIYNIDYKGGGNENLFIQRGTFPTVGVVYKHVLFESSKFKNNTASIIPIKTLLKRNGNGVEPIGNGDSIYLFCGFASQAIAVNDFGIVKTNGSIEIAETNLVSGVLGDKITIINGVFTVTVGTDYVGIIKRTGFITLV
jgi:hypothetical protein